jgi:hypothetical protein
MNAARRNTTSVFVRGVRTAVRRTGLPVALLSIGTLNLVPWGPLESMAALSQTVSAIAVLGMLYRWVRQKNRPQPVYVRVRV